MCMREIGRSWTSWPVNCSYEAPHQGLARTHQRNQWGRNPAHALREDCIIQKREDRSRDIQKHTEKRWKYDLWSYIDVKKFRYVCNMITVCVGPEKYVVMNL